MRRAMHRQLLCFIDEKEEKREREREKQQCLNVKGEERRGKKQE